MDRRIGFDPDKYLRWQVREIEERVSLFDKLYLEFGGKMRYDLHASRVLPGYPPETKINMLQQLGNIDIIHCISAKDIERRKIRQDFGLTYDDQIIKDIQDLQDSRLDVSGVVINRFDGESGVEKFKKRLENRGVDVWINYEIPNYPNDIDLILSDKGYGLPVYVETNEDIVVVTAPGPGSGKMSFCLAQVFRDRKRNIKSGFAKFETFPIWNLSKDHPVNIAYEAATADIGDFNVEDHFHENAYGVKAVNYNRDVENFVILRKIIDKMVDKNDPLTRYKSPTDMGVNMAKKGIIDDSVVREASIQEILRRYFRYNREYVQGDTSRETLDRMEKIMNRVGVKPEDRLVVLPAREAAIEATQRDDKGYRGFFSGASIEIYDSGKPKIITAKNSPELCAEAAAFLNAIKTIVGVPDEIDVISPEVIGEIKNLKIKYLNSSTFSLGVENVLDALAASCVSDKNAKICIDGLDQLRGCEMHSTYIMTPDNEIPLNQLGLNVTMDPKLPFYNI